MSRQQLENIFTVSSATISTENMSIQQLVNIFITPSASISAHIPVSRPRPRLAIRFLPTLIPRPRPTPKALPVDMD